ncbi:MAG: hypothetical protein MJE12_08615 [Alphaproteobacteria bacterium]|nr:hypothetical protein [Alphaproteobacteria bacterium]
MAETPIAETYPESRDTPHGKVYRPKSWLVQGLFLVLAFFGGPALGEVTGRMLGGVSENAQIFLYLPFVAIFFLGYGLWSARLHAIAFDGIGRGILKALFMLLIRRKKPEGLQDVMPSAEKLEKMAAQAQKAGWSFLVMAVPVALVAALVALFFETEASAFAAASMVGGTCLLWGWVMGLLARRGYLPIMQEGG